MDIVCVNGGLGTSQVCSHVDIANLPVQCKQVIGIVLI
jgi:hypothetical protein